MLVAHFNGIEEGHMRQHIEDAVLRQLLDMVTTGSATQDDPTILFPLDLQILHTTMRPLFHQAAQFGCSQLTLEKALAIHNRHLVCPTYSTVASE
jgi:hypothetical protein